MTRDRHRSLESAGDAVCHAVDKLRSFRDGDDAVLETVELGDRAIPLLRALLFEREPSGLYQARVRAVEALAKLDAHDVLVEFLCSPRDVIDPIERVGEDAVINASARALAYRDDDPHVLELLLDLARRPCLTGVIFALGTFRHAKAIPLLIEALSEDASRLTAEAALKRIGAAARPALLTVVSPPNGVQARESESRLRQRRSALRLVAEMGVARKAWQSLRVLMRDDDARIAITACEICLASGTPSDKRDAVLRLSCMSATSDSILQDEIKRRLRARLHALVFR